MYNATSGLLLLSEKTLAIFTLCMSVVFARTTYAFPSNNLPKRDVSMRSVPNDDLIIETLSIATSAFGQIESAVPRPHLSPAQGGRAFRYKEKSLEQAIVQKSARMISGLNAAHILILHGYVQEVAVLQRTLDEFCEDITFLCLPLHGEPLTDRHKDYLSYFYEEEFNEPGDPLTSEQRRGAVSRGKIQAAIANSPMTPPNPSDNIKVFKTLHKAYSGYVHGASPHIMDMYGGPIPHFHVQGMVGTPRIDATRRDLWNYLYRGVVCLALVATCFRLQSLERELMNFIARLDHAQN